jgi:hypothetical protein
MIANSAFLAAMVMLVLAFFVVEQLSFLSGAKALLLERYLWPIVGGVAVVFLNLFSLCYLTGRQLFLKETGRKLAHVEKQLHAGDTIVRDLSERLEAEE